MESPEEEKLLVAWVNSLGMPHCLLVDSYRDMLDGNALSEIIASKFDERKKKKKRTLSSSIEYLGRKFGWSSLPPFLSRRDAADMISLGEYRGMRDLLRFLRRMYEGKDYEDEDGEDSEEDRQQRHSASYRDSKDSTERQQRRIVRSRSSLHHRRHRRKLSASSSNRQRRRRNSSYYRRERSSQHYQKQHLEERNSSSSYYRREQSSQHHQKQHLEKQKPQWNASTSMMRSRKTFRKSSSKKSSTSSGGVFRMNDMIDPTYVPRKPSPPSEKKKKRKKKKKKRFQILSPVRVVFERFVSNDFTFSRLHHGPIQHTRTQVPRTSVPITSIQSPVYPSSNNLTVEQMDTIEWISRWLQQDTNSWKEISESFKDGILMCEIVQDVFKVRGVPLSLTQLTCRSMA